MSSLAGKHVIVFGCGYVGSAFAAAALARGAHVTALTRNADRAAALRAQGATVLSHELSSDVWHGATGTAPCAVVNTVSAADSTPEGYRRSYVEGTRSILRWAERLPQPIETFVYTSSTGVYPQSGGASVDETAPTGGSSVTGNILVEAENLLRAAPASAVRRSFVLRLAGIYGPGRHYLLNSLRAGTTRFAGTPSTPMNLVHRDDIVSAVLACLEAPGEIGSTVFNLSDGAPATKADLLAWLAARVGAAAPEFEASGAGNMRRGGEPSPERFIRSEKIRQVLGWTPRYPDFRSGYEAILRGEV